jgi:hypothetical protein
MEIKRERQRAKERDKERERYRETKRDKERERERERQRQTDPNREKHAHKVIKRKVFKEELRIRCSVIQWKNNGGHLMQLANSTNSVLEPRRRNANEAENIFPPFSGTLIRFQP